MKLDRNNDPAVRDFEDWVRRELYGTIDCQTCPQCKSKRTIALNEKFRRCKDCRHVFEPKDRK